jgi:transglutaminase-like putative cysteine protease
MVGRNLSLATIIQRLKVPATAVIKQSSFTRLIFDSLGEFRVGLGPVDDDPTERMTVLSPGPRYWRGRVYEQYTGNGWSNSQTQQSDDIFPEPGQDTPEGLSTFNLQPLGPKQAKSERESYRFRMSGGVFGPIYHAAEPVKVRAPVGRIFQRYDNTLGAGRGGGSEYEVESTFYEPKPTELRSTGRNYPQDIALRYLSTGPVNDEIQRLTQEALRNVPDNPFDKAQAIRRFIANRCIYTREARAVPKERDAVEFFLNDSKEGYCDLYATSMTVLCRYAGIPARVATGYAPGVPAEEGRKTDPKDKRTLYSLRGTDQHAWTEVFFNGYGWVVFDATQDTQAAFTPQATPEPIKKTSRWEQLWQNGKLSLILTGIGIFGFLFVLLNEFVFGRTITRVKSNITDARAKEVASIYQNTVRKIERRGVERPETMTPTEFRRLSVEVFGSAVDAPLGKLTGRLEQAIYGPSTVTEADVASARQEARDVLQAIAQSAKNRKGKGANVASGAE